LTPRILARSASCTRSESSIGRRADALLGTPDAIAIVEGDDLGEMDSVIDRIAELPGVLDTESKVARWTPTSRWPSLATNHAVQRRPRSVGRVVIPLP
jgi:hypothetical protein